MTLEEAIPANNVKSKFGICVTFYFQKPEKAAKIPLRVLSTLLKYVQESDICTKSIHETIP